MKQTMTNLYTVSATCHVCSKAYKARVNVAGRAKVCTPPEHICKRKVAKKPDGSKKIITCVDNCCRSQYRRGAAAAAMDNAIDPRKVLSDAEFDAVIKASRKLADPEGVTMRFVAATGCRLGEALLMRASGFFFQDGPVSIAKTPTLKRRGQGRPMRSVHLDNGAEIVKELKAWTKGLKPDDLVFPVARRTLQRATERLLEKHKPDHEGLVHIFRHTRASQLVASGAPLTYVRSQLGWSSLELLKIYAHTSDTEVAKYFERLR